MDTNGHPRLSDLLRAYRQQSRLTQEELAKRAGVSVNAIRAIERGASGAIRGTRQGTVELLADALGLDEAERREFIAARHSSPPRFDPSGLHTQQRGMVQLIGRTAEQLQIQRLLLGDGPPMLAYYGEPGVGKSRLLTEAEEQARRTGWTVLVGGSQQSDGQHPYTPLFQALERHIATQKPDELRQALQDCARMTLLLPELAALAPPSEQAWQLSAEQERRLMFAAIGNYLANIAGPRGIVLILDDLQWAEADGLRLLAYLLRMANDGRPPLSLRVVAASHDLTVDGNHPLRRTLQDLARDQLVSWTRLTPLNLEYSEKLLRTALEDVALEPLDQRETLIRKVLARSGGMPLFITSFAREIRDHARSGRGIPTDESVPWDVAELIRKRIHTLPEATRELLNVAAVYGRETPLQVLELMNGADRLEVVDAIELACAQHLLVDTEHDTCIFRHDLIRDVILDDLSNARRQMLHKRVADMLELQHQQGHMEPLAFHYRAGADVGRAIHYLEREGDWAQSLRADDAANARYEDALRLLAPSADDMTTARLQSKRGAILMAAGEYERALECFEAMAKAYEQVDHLDGVGQAAAQIGWAHVRGGSAKLGLARIEPLLATESMARMTPATQAALLTARAVLLFAVGRYGEQLQSARRACDLAHATNDQAARVRGMRMQGLALVSLGRLNEATPVLEETIRLAEALHDLDSFSAALNDAAAVLRARGDLRASWRYSEQALTTIEQLGDPMGGAFLSSSHGDDAFLLGDWKVARRCYERGVEMVRDLGASWVASYPLADLGYLNLLEGNDDAARALLTEALSHAASQDDRQALRHVQGILAERDLVAGAALDAVTRLEPLMDYADIAEKESTALLPLLARAYIALGRHDHAAKLLDLCRRQVDVTGAWLVWQSGLLAQALLCMRNGDLAQASVSVQKAVTRAHDMGYRYAEAKALALQGSLHALRDERAAAKTALSRALVLFDQLGERFYARQAANLLQRVNNAAS